jgi:thiosulfate/3-mercaptopyruvate sulfurtransferase
MSNLVSADWLATRLGSVILLDASIHRDEHSFGDGRADFEGSHLPGARFADLFAAFSDPSAEFGFTRPSAGQFEAAARAVGINDDSTVVVYDRLTGAWAARLWWVFRSFGFLDVRVLDGGLAAWVSSGGSLVDGPAPEVAAGSVRARPQDGFFIDLPTVKQLSDATATPVVCALRRTDYVGSADEPRSGHIPGSVNLPYPDLLNADGTLSLEAVRSGAGELGLERGAPAVLYCGGGINAAGLALALTEAGYDGLSVYDGSMNEWRADPTLPVVHGETP